MADATTAEPTITLPPPITDHAAHSAALLAHAQEMIDKGDRLQASEKIWGAVAHKLKEIARKRGWSWRKHGAYNALVGYLRNETDNPELGTLFRSADSLHANFYDDQYEHWQLVDGLADAKKLIALLDAADSAVPQDAPLPRGLRRLTPESGGASQSRGG